MHVKRILTGVIAFSLLSLLLIKGTPLMFAVFIGAASLVTLIEYYQIVFSDQKEVVFSPITIWGALVGLMIISAAYFQLFQIIFLLLIFNLMGAAILSMSQYKKSPDVLNVVAKVSQGVIYIPASLCLIVLLRGAPDGIAWIFFLLFMVFAGDTGALYAGKFFGKHKLSPSISPGKTIEGSIGGLVFSMMIGYIFIRLFLPHLNTPFIFLLFIVVNFFAQTGDLFESQLKRTGNIKDSGNILPGHGGILDRIDALLFAVPILYLFKEFVL
jgi:phosphatidate cytidylyltransferase